MNIYEKRELLREAKRQLGFAQTMLTRWDEKYVEGRKERVAKIEELQQRVSELEDAPTLTKVYDPALIAELGGVQNV